MNMHHTDGEWLCPPGEYQSLVKALCASDPRLRHRDPKSVNQGTPWPPRNERVVGLRLGASGSFESVYEWSAAHRPQNDFFTDLRRGAVVNPNDCNVLLIEGISPRMVEALGVRFGIHPSFFVDHERVGLFSSRHDRNSSLTTLPHCAKWLSGNNGLTLKYYEVLDLTQGTDTFYMSCAESGRHIGAFRLNGRISPTVVVRRKCSVWPSTHPGGGYTCVILCDPPLRLIRMNTQGSQRFNRAVQGLPYQGGYRDFVPQEAQKALRVGPPRLSMLDDLRFYLTNHGQQLSPHTKQAFCAAQFVQKIAASHYLTLSTFMGSVLSHEQWQLSRRPDMSTFKLETAEQQWSDIQAWDRRLSEYSGDIEDAMMKLGINLEEPDFKNLRRDTWLEADVDFQYLRMQFKTLGERVGQINAAITGLVGIAGNRQAQAEQLRSTRQSQRATALTFIGLLFVPLAFVSGLLSMNERFIPGAGDFWLYFAISVPLILLTLLFYVALDRAYIKSFIHKRRLSKEKRAKAGNHK